MSGTPVRLPGGRQQKASNCQKARGTDQSARATSKLSTRCLRRFQSVFVLYHFTKKAGRILFGLLQGIAEVSYGTNFSLFIVILSTETPQVCPGRTSAQVPIESWVNSKRSCAEVPAIPGNSR